MPDTHQKVMVMNTTLAVEAAAPLPVTSPEPLKVEGVVTVGALPKYEYKIIDVKKFLKPPPAGHLGEQPSLDEAALERKLNEGWELHQVLYAIGTVENAFIFRRPK